MKNKSLIIIIVALVAVVAIAAIVYPSLADKANEALETTSSVSSSDTTDEKQYPKAKDIKIFDTDGNEVKLSDFYGKPIILNFWATWCGYCVQEMPDIEEAFKEHGDEIQFLIVNTDDGIEKGEAFLKNKGYTFPTYYDLDYNAAITYSITGIPRTIAIDKDGFIRYNRAGMISADTLEGIIEMIK